MLGVKSLLLLLLLLSVMWAQRLLDSRNLAAVIQVNGGQAPAITVDTCVDIYRFHSELSDSCETNQSIVLVLMKKKGCMQHQACVDSIWYYRGKSVAYMELASKFRLPMLYPGVIIRDSSKNHVYIKPN